MKYAHYNFEYDDYSNPEGFETYRRQIRARLLNDNYNYNYESRNFDEYRDSYREYREGFRDTYREYRSPL